MKQNCSSKILLHFLFLFSFFLWNAPASYAQNLISFVDNCETNCTNCNGKIKKIVTKHKVNFMEPRSPYIYKVNEYNNNEQLVKSEIKIGRDLQNTIHYHFIDSLLIYEHHISPGINDFFLVYQYYQKRLPTRVLKVDKQRKIINYSNINYTKKEEPVNLELFDLAGKLLAKRSIEYYSKNQIVIREYSVEREFSKFTKYELLCKFNQPKKLKKTDFKDMVTRPINLEVNDNIVRIVKAVQVEKKEKVQIDEITYDIKGNWINKKTFELKNNKNKRRLVMEIEREIEYY